MNIFEKLKEQGWTECRPTLRYPGEETRQFIKPSHSFANCQANSKPPVVTALWLCVHDAVGDTVEQWELSIRGQNADGMWCDFRVYAMSPAEFAQSYHKAFVRLVLIWEAANQDMGGQV